MRKITEIIAYFAITAMFMVMPLSVWGDTTVIENVVNTSASTGGQSSDNSRGTGKSSSRVQIKTTVNGEVVEDIDETVTASEGEDAVIEKKVEVNMSNVHSSTKVEVKASAEEGLLTSGEQATSSEKEQGTETVISATSTEDSSPVVAFLNKIFNYVLSIFKA
jgi:hypothetical protein